MSKNLVKYILFSFPVASAGLGVWQVKRLGWKRDLLDNLNKQISDEPVDLIKIGSLNDLQNLEYRQMRIVGKYDPDPSHQLFLKPRSLVVNEEAVCRGRTAHQSNIGVNVITPFQLDGTDLRILVNRGWLASKGDTDSVQSSVHIGLGSKSDPPIELVGVLRKTDNRPRYGATNDQSSNIWQFRDIDQMAKALHTAPIFIDARQDKNRTEGPIGGQTVLSVRNEHLNYAITWFSLSACSMLMWYARYGKKSLFKKLR